MNTKLKLIEDNVERLGVKLINLSSTAIMLSILFDGDTDYPSRRIISEAFHNFADQLEEFGDMATHIAGDIFRERSRYETTERARDTAKS